MGWEGVKEKLEVGETYANRIVGGDCLKHLKGTVDSSVPACVGL